MLKWCWSWFWLDTAKSGSLVRRICIELDILPQAEKLQTFIHSHSRLFTTSHYYTPSYSPGHPSYENSILTSYCPFSCQTIPCAPIIACYECNLEFQDLKDYSKVKSQDFSFNSKPNNISKTPIIIITAVEPDGKSGNSFRYRDFVHAY